MHVHLLVHEGEERALGPNHGELEDIAVTGLARRGLTALLETLAALFLHAAIGYRNIPVIKKPNSIKEAAIEQIVEHQHRDFGHPFGADLAGVMSRVIRAGDGGLALKARVLGALAAKDTHIPGGLPGLSLFIEGVARAGAKEKHGDDLPPEVGRRIAAHLLNARVGQVVEPLVEPGESGPHDTHHGLRA